jgi:hypothetical protein
VNQPKCRICAHPAKSAIALWERLGTSRRRTSEVFEVGEATLRRHAAHADKGRDHAVEAAKLVDKAWKTGSVRQLVRAESGLRAAIKLDMVDWSKTRVQLHDPSPHDVEALMGSLERAWRTYEAHQSSLTAAGDALAGVRAALRAVREARASTEDAVDVAFIDPAGEHLSRVEGSLQATWTTHQIPPMFRDGSFAVRVRMRLDPPPDVEVLYGGRVLYAEKEVK